MRIWILTLLSLGMLEASPITTKLLDVQETHGNIEASGLKEGMSGFVVRHFDATHSTIISNARVTQFNPQNNRALITFSEYDGLHQNSLPSGSWTPRMNDEVVFGYDYQRALLITGNDDSYLKITKTLPNLNWVHPDTFATYLSHIGHPTPLVEDFHDFCTAHSIGLLYVHVDQTLFQLDCKNFAFLGNSMAAASSSTPKIPFYSRIPTIRANWFGAGSSRLDTYEPYYLEEIALNNPKNQSLYELYKGSFSEQSALLRHFELKE